MRGKLNAYLFSCTLPLSLLTMSHPQCRLFVQHKLYFAYIKHLWATDRREESITRLGLLCNVVGKDSKNNRFLGLDFVSSFATNFPELQI